MPTTPATKITVQLASAEEWPESDEVHASYLAARLREEYPHADVDVTVGEVSATRVYGDVDEHEIREFSQDIWNELCAHPEAHGL